MNFSSWGLKEVVIFIVVVVVLVWAVREILPMFL